MPLKGHANIQHTYHYLTENRITIFPDNQSRACRKRPNPNRSFRRKNISGTNTSLIQTQCGVSFTPDKN